MKSAILSNSINRKDAYPFTFTCSAALDSLQHRASCICSVSLGIAQGTCQASTMSCQSRPCQSMNVRVAKSLNESEGKYIKERKEKIEKCLRDNGIDCKADHVPHIAVLGSGGGERAMVGMLGCLDQMGQDNLLDSALYLCGVSGSTWCMSSLYEDHVWSTKVHNLTEILIKRITETHVDLSALIKWLVQAMQDENYSLTDFWAATVVYGYIKKIDQSHLSDTKVDPINPYPIYTVNDQGLKKKGENACCWFELSPHEVGYSHVGAFVDTSNFRSRFEAGKLVKKEGNEERDMLYIQGLCGSALADGDENIKTIKDSIWSWVKKIFDFGKIQTEEKSCDRGGFPFGLVKKVPGVSLIVDPLDQAAFEMISILLQLHECCQDAKESSNVFKKLKQQNSGLLSGGGLFGIHCKIQDLNPIKLNKIVDMEDTWISKPVEEREDCVAELAEDIFNTFSACFQILSDVPRIVLKTLSLIKNWTWGTKHNFLYNHPNAGEVPQLLLSDTHTYLIDAGMLLNSPYMAALRPERKVDLILSFDFSAGDPFLTVNLAAEYCKESGIPFPPVDVPEEEKENPKDFYVFKGEQGPTVIHMPLFNVVNCEGDVEKWRERYPTFTLAYNKETAEDLRRVAALNVANNKKRILEEIKAVC
ncbi:hypothetical protein AGOR_G00042360 [Albula goreensis]|uniref:PLA2c domain-containing protein n=1 Tax=Albula goreensis TaxID=1534307 RepID=A0A8T3DY07_9TELE|nr:hypothetical protein AGOR_G00042360 [Albula goreensis]